MHQLKYLEEIRPMDEIDGIDAPQKVDAKELSLGKTLGDNLAPDILEALKASLKVKSKPSKNRKSK
jgi:non-homologous end joining protein Ku